MATALLAPAPVVRTASAKGVQLTLISDRGTLHIPSWVKDLASFRRWVTSDDVPEKGFRICYLNGEVWVDMSKEQIFTHNQVKAEFAMVLGGITKSARLGRFFPDGLLISNVEANLSAGPDGIFVSYESLRAGRVKLVEGKKQGYVELEGSPDMVLEVISESSVRKDPVTLRDLYWRAGVREYWLVDARGSSLSFDILRYAGKGYASTRKQGGWLKSLVFGKSFHFSQQTDVLGNPEYTLAVR